ncbi:hypothetical protein APS56_15440 [Pseudalgibacter alginicilyticus]|uniref:Uncharacterized protein n=1 Tax=Pseudalgibacter alginicilyticus TaxID=1736674 RepID=A0A0P0CJN3_9FLAO|nr:hypothetical protein [Pseudalgibacter alginicilyticus]ALJ06441.1 hypothetical protein APS56_15440 [Pseudalgibacter alginicilyticus]
MKYLLLFFCFSLSLSTAAQNFKATDSIQLPPYLSLIPYINKAPSGLKTNLKVNPFSINQLDKMSQRHFVKSPKNLNKNFSFLEFPTIDLKKELQNVMHKIPGETVMAGPKGFTL